MPGASAETPYHGRREKGLTGVSAFAVVAAVLCCLAAAVPFSQANGGARPATDQTTVPSWAAYRQALGSRTDGGAACSELGAEEDEQGNRGLGSDDVWPP